MMMQSRYQQKDFCPSEDDGDRLENSKISDPFQVVDAVHQDLVELNDSLALLKRLLPNLDLTNIQTTVFLQSWQGRTYQQIADSTGYDADYMKDVGHKLWKKLSEGLGEPIKKHNFCSVIRRRAHEFQAPGPVNQVSRIVRFPRSVDALNHSQSPCDWGEAPVVPLFAGRDDELARLKRWVVEEHNRVVGIFGLGGIGKTALAVKCVEQVADRFDCLIWRSLRNTPDIDDLITGLLRCLSKQDAIEIPEAPDAKISLLLKVLNQSRCLLVIDDWSAVLRPDSPAGGYQNQHMYYGLLLRRLSESRHQSCVLIVSREKPAGLALHDNPVFPVRNLYLRGLKKSAGQEVLQALGLSETDDNLAQLLNRYDGNPYALRVAAKTVTTIFGNHISRFLKQDDFIYGDIRVLIDQQFERLSTLEKTIMYCLVELSEPVTMEKLEQNIAPSVDSALLEGLESLYNRAFIQKEGAAFCLPWLLRQYTVDKKRTEGNVASQAALG